jgi:hypothetical protein
MAGFVEERVPQGGWFTPKRGGLGGLEGHVLRPIRALIGLRRFPRS